MGRKSQEKMTGKTFDERVLRGKSIFHRFMKRVRRGINKGEPTMRANNSRSGQSQKKLGV
jgi:hypothetical protein